MFIKLAFKFVGISTTKDGNAGIVGIVGRKKKGDNMQQSIKALMYLGASGISTIAFIFEFLTEYPDLTIAEHPNYLTAIAWGLGTVFWVLLFIRQINILDKADKEYERKKGKRAPNRD